MDGSRIRVLVTAFAAVPGSNPHSPALLAMASALRAEVDLVSLKTDTLPHVEQIDNARMFRVPVGDAPPLEQRRIFDRAVARQLEADRYDVVHVRGPFEGMLAAERRAELGYTLVYEMATFPDEALGAEVERRWAEAHDTCLLAADLVLVPTEAARRAALERVPEERVLVCPPGVDLGRFDWRPGGSPERARLLYLGSFTADRDLATLLGAVRRVQSSRPLEVLIAGDTDRGRRERLRKMVDAFELGAVVEVRGEPRSRALPAIIGGADLCLATASEVPRFQILGDLPEPLLEYLACHRPVVAAGVPGVAEVLRDEHEGLLYPPGDEVALAEAILEMLRNDALRERTTDAGYRRVRELFSSGARQRRMEQAYEGLVGGSQHADAWAESFPEGRTGEHEMRAPASSTGPPMIAALSTARSTGLSTGLSTGEALASAIAPDGPLEGVPEVVDDHVTTDAGRRAAEPATSEMDAVPDLDSEKTLARVERVVETDPGSRPPHLDTDPGSRP